MPAVASKRNPHASLRIFRASTSDYTELVDYLTEIDVHLGSIDEVGTGAAGVDGVVRVLNFTLHNEGTVRFSPLDTASTMNSYGGSTDALLSPNREVRLRLAVESTEGTDGDTTQLLEFLGIGDGATTVYQLDQFPVVEEAAITVSTGSALRWSDFTSSGSTSNTWADSGYRWSNAATGLTATTDYTLAADAGTVAFSTSAIPASATLINVTYTYWQAVFHGILRDSIKTAGPTVAVACGDMSRRLQRTFIETSTQYGSTGGTALETVLQAIITDHVTDPPTVVVPASPGFDVLQTDASKVEFESVWDANQRFVAPTGWFFGEAYSSSSRDFELTLFEPPRTKSSLNPDFELTHTDDVYVEKLDISDEEVRNAVVVRFLPPDSTTIQSVTVTSTGSIDKFGRRAMLLDEDSASLIDTTAEATDFANALLDDQKDPGIPARISMPLFLGMDVFKTFMLSNPRTHTNDVFYAVQSVRHTLRAGEGSFNAQARTEVIARGRVIGGVQRWKALEARPGTGRQPLPARALRALQLTSRELGDAAVQTRSVAANAISSFADVTSGFFGEVSTTSATFVDSGIEQEFTLDEAAETLLYLDGSVAVEISVADQAVGFLRLFDAGSSSAIDGSQRTMTFDFTAAGSIAVPASILVPSSFAAGTHTVKVQYSLTNGDRIRIAGDRSFGVLVFKR
ncbi:hypothetical protein [Microbacterium sp.]|uniref:hypothetical protein n=1 Tax=Microbacterium sp. TaxID=51671 RepID=UPI002734DE46|nr:hypothetical protein [Microbacterium sp.]MDP3949924.1 hypothetical protein [Microbacterium sp.]